MPGHVEDPLLRVQRRALAADLGQRVDDPAARLAHPGPERGREPDRAGADDRDVDGLVAHAAGSASESGVPSSALSARSTDVETQVNVGVSRLVYADASVVRRRCTRSRKRDGLVGLERDDELLVVEAERVRRVEVDVRVLLADLDVLLHDLPALVRGHRVPLARLDERVDEQVAAVGRADLQARLVGVLRRLGHRQVGVGLGAPLHQPALGEHDVELVDALEVRRLAEQHQVGVAAGADGRERAQQALGGEVLAGGQELALVLGALVVGKTTPGRIDLQEGVLDEMAFGHDSKDRRGSC